ncbi:MAG: HAMP domain-containing protein [Anaerolineae bacterium]|nr:HAMP domain-containing protein [Anaerolineae bacterium]
MNRLWVRLSLMIGGVLFLVFFMQFLAITFDRDAQNGPGSGAAPTLQTPGAPGADGEPDQAEIARRLLNFMALSLVVGLMAGVVIGRVVSAPMTDLARAAQHIGAGNLDTRVKARGSREMLQLADTFNKMAADLQHAETLRNNLMADVSHELRTPLTVLEGNLRAALDHVYALDEAEIANLYGQTRHLMRLVNDLRDLSLAETHQLPLEKQPTDLNALVTETLQALEPLAVEKGVQLADQTDKLPQLTVDPIRMRQVLFNLLFNALRHTPADGQVFISAGLREGEAWLAVQDSGEGLEAGHLAAVFDRFYRADRSRSRETGGTGLGLAIVKAIVEAHGGRIEAHSEGKGRGCRFVITLPGR